MRRALPLAVLALAACASAAVPPPDSGAQARRATWANTSQGYEIMADRAQPMAARPVDAGPALVWSAVQRAYADLNIPVSMNDPSTMTVGNGGMDLRQKLNGEPLNTYLDCGTTTAGVVANVYRVHLTVWSRVTPGPAGAGSQLQTTVSATARNPGSSSAPVRCASTGRLEQLIQNQTLRAIALGTPS